MQVLKVIIGVLILIGCATGFWRGLVDGLLSPWLSGAYPLQAPTPVLVLALVLTLVPYLLLSHLSKK